MKDSKIMKAFGFDRARLDTNFLTCFTLSKCVFVRSLKVLFTLQCSVTKYGLNIEFSTKKCFKILSMSCLELIVIYNLKSALK